MTRRRSAGRLAVALVALLSLAACGADRAEQPADTAELRDRVWTALPGDGEQILHLEFSTRSPIGIDEVIRETWVDWRRQSIRQGAYDHSGDPPPPTLVVGQRQYYPPDPTSLQVSREVGGQVVAPLEVLVLPLLLLRLAGPEARVSRAELDGEPVWRLRQSGLAPREGDRILFCIDIELDFDARTELPLAAGVAGCGGPDLARGRFYVEWLGRDHLHPEFFDPPRSLVPLGGRGSTWEE